MDIKQKFLKICGIPTNELCKNIDEFITLFNQRDKQLNEVLDDVKNFLREVKKSTTGEIFELYKQHYIKNHSFDFFINMKFATINFSTSLNLNRDYSILKDFNEKYCTPSKVAAVQAVLTKAIAGNVCSVIDIEHLNNFLREISKNINILKQFHNDTKANPRLVTQYLYDKIKKDLDKLNTSKQKKRDEINKLVSFFNDIKLIPEELENLKRLEHEYNDLYQEINKIIQSGEIAKLENTNRYYSKIEKVLDAFLSTLQDIQEKKANLDTRLYDIEDMNKHFNKFSSNFEDINKKYEENILYTSSLNKINQINTQYNMIKQDTMRDINIIKTKISKEQLIRLDETRFDILVNDIKKINENNKKIITLTKKRDDIYIDIKDNITSLINELNSIIDTIYSNTTFTQLQTSPLQSVRDKIEQCKVNELKSVFDDLTSLGANDRTKANEVNIKKNIKENTLTDQILNEFTAKIVKIRDNYQRFEKCVNDSKKLSDKYNELVQKTNTYKIKLEQIITNIITTGSDPEYKALVDNPNPSNPTIKPEIAKCQNDIGNTKIIPKLTALGADFNNKIANLHINTHITNNTLIEHIYNTFKVEVDSLELLLNEYKQCIENVKALNAPSINYAVDKLITYNNIPANKNIDLEVLLLLIKKLFSDIDKKPKANWSEVKTDLINILKSEHLDYFIKNMYDTYEHNVSQRKIIYKKYITIISGKYINGLNSITLNDTELKAFVDAFIKHINKEINQYLNTTYGGNITNINIVYDLLNRMMTLSIKNLIEHIVNSKQLANNYINYYESAENVNRSESIAELFGSPVTFDSILKHVDIVKYFPKNSASSSVILKGNLKANPRKSKPSIKNTELYNKAEMVLKITWGGNGDEIAELKMYNELFKLVKYNLTPNILCRIFSGEIPNYGPKFHSKLSPVMRDDIRTASYDSYTGMYGLTNITNKVQVTITNPGEINFYNFISGQKESTTSPTGWEAVNDTIKATTEQLRAVTFQIMYTLYVFDQIKAQQGDLHGGNVFINTLPEEIDLCYLINDGVNNIPYRVRTNKLVKIYDFDRGYIGKNTTIKINHVDTRTINIQDNTYSEGTKIVNFGKYRDLSIFIAFSLYGGYLPSSMKSDYNGQLWRIVGSTKTHDPTLDAFSAFVKQIIPMITNNNDYFQNLSKPGRYNHLGQRLPWPYGGLHGRPDRLLQTNTDILPFIHHTNPCILKNSYFDTFRTAATTKPLNNKTEIIYTTIGKL